MTEITPVISALITLISGILTAFVVPYIKTKVSTEKLEQAITIVETAVLAAEQIYNAAGMGEKKKEYVKKFLEERGFTYDEKEIDVMIESAVFKMKEELL